MKSNGPHDGIADIEAGRTMGGGGCCGTAASIEQIGQPGYQGTSSTSCTGATSCNGISILIDVIPDGVASVTYYFPSRASPALPARGLTVTTRPISNVLAVKVPIGAPFATRITWRATNGVIIKTLHTARAQKS
jgi:hypothetical protein